MTNVRARIVYYRTFRDLGKTYNMYDCSENFEIDCIGPLKSEEWRVASTEFTDCHFSCPVVTSSIHKTEYLGPVMRSSDHGYDH